MMSLLETAQALGGRLVSGAGSAPDDAIQARVFTSVSTDSRNIPVGALFVALRGERFDGHDFLPSVRDRGAVVALVDETYAQAAAGTFPLPVVVVPDTRVALGQLAAHWRGRFDIPLVAVVGSNGKTTVKEMTAAILRAHYGAEATLSTAGNFNNDIGLPLTLLRLRQGHAAAVVEIGMNHPGETKTLAAMARPTVALVNNAQREHQEFMASVEEVAREHGSLFEALTGGGVAVINADDAHADYWRALVAGSAGHAGHMVRDFGLMNPAAVTARHAEHDFGSDVVLSAPEGTARFRLHAAGLHNVRNALGAAAAAIAAGASLAAVEAGLGSFAPVSGRLQNKRSMHGALVIDDTYNANPDSVRAAIDVLAQCPSPRHLVLGDMGEVGSSGVEFYREIGAHARSRGVSRLLGLGDMSAHAVAAFNAGRSADGFHAGDFEQLLAEVRTADQPGASVLVKGSRFMRMERVVNALVGEGA